MNQHHSRSLAALISIGLVLGSFCGRAGAQAPPAGKPVATALQPFVDGQTLAGAVTLIASKDKILDVETVGYMDVAAKKPMQADCLFWIASMSKPMTAAALMMLVDEGKVNVDDPVAKYLPEFNGQMLIVEQAGDHQYLRTPSHPILVREVLSHTSGLPFVSRVEPRIDTRPLREAALSYALTNLKFDPGTKYDYANSGINTAGRIIEVVSGMPYETFLQKRLFEPLGMKDTTFQLSAEQVQRLAKSYKPGPNNTGLEETTIGQLSYPLDGPNRYPCPAGGLFSTAADTGAFGMLILGGGVYNGKRLISEASVRQMTSIQTDHAGYGFGFSASKRAPADGSGTVPVGDCGHGGAYATDLWISPEHGITTVWMVQHAGYPGKDGGRVGGEFRKVAVEGFGKK